MSLIIGISAAIASAITGISAAMKLAICPTISIITGAAACTNEMIPGTICVIMTVNICSMTGTTFAIKKFTIDCTTEITLRSMPTSLSKTAAPLSPKISCILSRAAPMLPSLKMPFMVSPTFVITATILSKTASASSPKVRCMKSRTSCKWSFNILNTVITAVTIPTIGSTFPAIPPSGPSAVFARLPIGPSIVLTAFPIGANRLPMPPTAFDMPPVINDPMRPIGLFAITLPTPDSKPPSLPPIALNGVKINPSIFEPAPVNAPAAFPASPDMPPSICVLMPPKNAPTLPVSAFPLNTLPIAVPTPPSALPTLPK